MRIDRNTLLEIERDQKKKDVFDIRWKATDGFLSVLILVALLTGVYFLSAWIIRTINPDTIISSENITNLSFSILYGVQVFSMLAVVWFLAIYWRGSKLKDLGFRYYSLLKALWYSFLALLVIFFIIFVYVIIMTNVLHIQAPVSKIEQLASNQSISYKVLLITVSLIAPICEEIYFRGFLYSAFKKSWGVTAGLFLSSLFFALAHMEFYSFFPIMAIGWILAYIYEKTKSIIPVILLHSSYNLILIITLLSQLEVIKLF